MNRIERKNAVSVKDAVLWFFRESGLSAGYNTYCVGRAWDAVSGAAGYTSGKYFKDGVLHVTVNSSVAGMHLRMQEASLVAKINDFLLKEELFDKDNPRAGLVKSIRIK